VPGVPPPAFLKKLENEMKNKYAKENKIVLLIIIAMLVLLFICSVSKADYIVEMNVSAYCPCEKCCGEWADGFTACGKLAQGCFVAAPRSYPFGTILVIPGYNDSRPVPVLDRGGAIKGNKLDVFFSTHQAALNWGRRTLKVRVVE